MRRFEFSEGSSNKFWQIALEGASFTVIYGKVGTGGQTQTKSFENAEKAAKEHDKLVAEKVKKGYQEVAGVVTPAATPAPAAADGGPKKAVEALWERAKAYLKENHPKHFQALAKGASAAQIAKLEKGLGVSLPEDFKASLSLVDGQKGGPSVLRNWELFSCTRILSEWTVWKELYDDGEFEDNEAEPEGPVKPHWMHPLWIPITGNGGGDHHCLDLDPDSGGQPGQVIQMWHDDGPRTLEGSSFLAWFESFVDELEAGEALEDDDEDDEDEEEELGDARRFEFCEGNSNKFWEISLEGESFTVSYGKIGTDGQSQTKTFDSNEKAQTEYDKLIAEKVKKGYEEV